MIGSKLGVSFVDFIVYNGPLTLIMVPLSSYILYWRFKDVLQGKCDIDIERMAKENQITDKFMLLQVPKVFMSDH